MRPVKSPYRQYGASRWRGGLDEFGQHAPQIGRVQERDGGAHGPVSGPLVDQPDARPGHRGQGLSDVTDTVPDMVDPLTSPGQELAHRGVRRQRLEQLDVAHAQRAGPGRARIMASRTPCSSFTSRLTTSSPNVAWYSPMARSRSRQAMPT